MVNRIYPPEPELNKTSYSYTEAPFLDLNLLINNGSFYKKYYKRDDFDFEIVNFPFLDGDVPRCLSYYIEIIHLWLKIQEIFPEGVANHVNKRVHMHEFVYKICKSRGKYFLYF